MIEIGDIEPYSKNPRNNEKAIEAVRLSIRKHGFNQPIVVDQNNRICVGHTRWLAAKAEGLKKVPVVKKKMSEAEFIAYNLADNKSHEYSKWDDDLLAELMQEIEKLDESLLTSTAFKDEEIEALLDTTDLDDLIGDGTTTVSEHERGPGGEKAHVKMVQLFYNDMTFPKFIEMCEAIQLKAETENLTDTVFHSVTEVYTGLK